MARQPFGTAAPGSTSIRRTNIAGTATLVPETALTNVALGIACTHHFGKPVLVAPPAVVRPIKPGQDWFRVRGGNHAYLPWWGLHHDAAEYVQGFSQ